MANELATPPAPPAATPEAIAQMREQLAREAGAREQAERMAAAVMSRPVAPPEPIEDPYDRYTAESLKMSPEEQKAALDRGTRLRVRQEVAPELNRLASTIQRQREEDQYQAALDNAKANNPDIAENPQLFAAAAAAAEYEIRAGGQKVGPGEYIRRSVAKYRDMFSKKETPPPAYVEGATPPANGAPMTPEKPAPPPEVSSFARFYGEEMSDAKLFDENAEEDFKKMTAQYANEKNDSLETKGVRTYIPRVLGPMRKRKKAQAAAAAAAGK